MTSVAPLAANGLVTPARRGRPKLLTRERILDATLEMLAENGLAGFAMNRLAQRLGASVMTLYTYFPSREALLDDAAGRIFNGFAPPADDLPWRAAIEAWLRALHSLFDQYPIGLRLIKWDGAITPSWLKVWIPLLRILSRTGLKGRSLLVAASWVGRVGLALLIAKVAEDEEMSAIQRTAARDPTLSVDDRALLAALTDQPDDQRTAALYEFGITNILNGLATLVPADAVVVGKSRSRRTPPITP